MGRSSLGLSHTVGWGFGSRGVGGCLLARWACEAPVGPLADWWAEGGTQPVWPGQGEEAGGNGGGVLDSGPEWWLPVCPACSPRLLPLSGHFKGMCLPSLFQSHFCPCSLSLPLSLLFSLLFLHLYHRLVLHTITMHFNHSWNLRVICWHPWRSFNPNRFNGKSFSRFSSYLNFIANASLFGESLPFWDQNGYLWN